MERPWEPPFRQRLLCIWVTLPSLMLEWCCKIHCTNIHADSYTSWTPGLILDDLGGTPYFRKAPSVSEWSGPAVGIQRKLLVHLLNKLSHRDEILANAPAAGIPPHNVNHTESSILVSISWLVDGWRLYIMSNLALESTLDSASVRLKIHCFLLDLDLLKEAPKNIRYRFPNTYWTFDWDPLGKHAKSS